MPRLRNTAMKSSVVDVGDASTDPSKVGHCDSNISKDASRPSCSDTDTTCIPFPTPSPSPISTSSTLPSSSPLPTLSTASTPPTPASAEPKRKHIALTHPSHPKTHPSHIPRPRNAFILFRSYTLSSGLLSSGGSGPIQQNEASREIARIWKGVDDETRRQFEEMAGEEKRRHKEMYPGYRYAPKKAGGGSITVAGSVRPPLQLSVVATDVKGAGEREKDQEPRGRQERRKSQATTTTKMKMNVRPTATRARTKKRRAPLTPDTTPEPSPSPSPSPTPTLQDDDAFVEKVEEDEDDKPLVNLFGGVFASIGKHTSATQSLRRQNSDHPEFSFPLDNFSTSAPTFSPTSANEGEEYLELMRRAFRPTAPLWAWRNENERRELEVGVSSKSFEPAVDCLGLPSPFSPGPSVEEMVWMDAHVDVDADADMDIDMFIDGSAIV